MTWAAGGCSSLGQSRRQAAGWSTPSPRNGTGLRSRERCSPALSLAACDCDPRGIETPQCDQSTGRCVCAEGVEGPRCDRCARGFSGAFPDCAPCHQCFAVWDVIVAELTSRTQRFLERAQALKIGGVLGPYRETVDSVEKRVSAIRDVVAQSPAAQPLENIGGLFEEAE